MNIPVVYRWWMNYYDDEKREHRIEEDREGREYRSEGAKDINRSNIDRANITYSFFMDNKNYEADTGGVSSESTQEESEEQSKEIYQAKSTSDASEEDVIHIAESSNNQQANDVTSD
ncbi:MAG: hypothetical protein QW215_05935, partial [Ignisphaera sp.]